MVRVAAESGLASGVSMLAWTLRRSWRDSVKEMIREREKLVKTTK